LLHRRGLYCSKQLETTSNQFGKKSLHITFNTTFGEGKVGSSESVAAASIREHYDTKAQPAPPSPHRAADRLSTLVWCHTASTVANSGSLAYCATLGVAASRSAVDDVMIIDHFVK